MRWVVDPIDGTVNFLYGIPQYAVSIAAEVDGEVVAGVVLDVAKRVEYVARPGADGATVALRDGVADRGARPGAAGAAAGRHRLLLRRRASRSSRPRAVGRLLPRVRDVRRLGSCALDLCHVAEGLLDGYVEEGVNLWDHAAGGLIARAAGARTETGARGRRADAAAVRSRHTASTSCARPPGRPGSGRNSAASDATFCGIVRRTGVPAFGLDGA